MKSYIIELPRGVKVNIFNIPENFDAIVLKCFAEYTEGTSAAYRDVDRLGFIDVFVKKLHKSKGDYVAIVDDYIEGLLYGSWKEEGQLPFGEDVYCRETMYELYRLGQESREIAAKYGGDYHIYDEIHKILARAIKIVSNATEEDIGEALHDK